MTKIKRYLVQAVDSAGIICTLTETDSFRKAANTWRSWGPGAEIYDRRVSARVIPD